MQYDSQGRIQIPDSLLEYANINKNITVIGVIKKIELWDQNTLEKYESKKDIFTDNDFDELAQEINF